MLVKWCNERMGFQESPNPPSGNQSWEAWEVPPLPSLMLALLLWQAFLLFLAGTILDKRST